MYLPIPFLFSMIEEDSGGVSGTFNKIYANDFAVNDHFGYSVAISGDGNTLVIGSRNDDDKGSDSGSAYVFIKNGTMWLQQQKLIASDGAASDNFGWVVSISDDGNTIAVGAYRDDDKGSDSGSVYIFNRINNNWSETKKIVLSNGTALDYFGYDLELSGDGNTIIIGAYGDNDDVSTNIEVGSAIIYEYDGTDWLFKQKIRPNNIVTNADSYWSGKENERLGNYTHDDWLRCAPQDRKNHKNPKQSEIVKGREEIARDALKREKELKAIEQGAVDTD